MRRDSQGFRRWLLAATALGAVIRVAWLVAGWNDPIGFEDAFFYHHQANLLADGKGFISPFPYLASGVSSPAAEHPPDAATVERVLAVARLEAGATDVGAGWRVTRSAGELRLVPPAAPRRDVDRGVTDRVGGAGPDLDSGG